MEKRTKLFLTIAVSVVMVHVLVAFAGTIYINYALDKNLKEYDAKIDLFYFNIFFAEYSILDLEVKKKNLKEKFIVLDKIKGDINFLFLLKGDIVLNISARNGEINFIDSKNDNKDQLGTAENKDNWVKAIKVIVPLSINELKLNNIKLNFSIDKKDSLVNSILVKKVIIEKILEEGLSNVDLEGEINSIADFKLDGGIDFSLNSMPVDLDFHLSKLDLSSFNKVLLNYVPIDITSGKVEIYSELKGSLDDAEGYAKVFLENLDIIGEEQDYVSIPHFFIEWIGGFFNWAISVIIDEKVATEIDLDLKNKKLKNSSFEMIKDSLVNLEDKLERGYKNI